jgi:lipopolysaccharide/colanic/teichoic acid biosynthesis glycosyltransferase
VIARASRAVLGESCQQDKPAAVISPWCNSHTRRMLDIAGAACLLVPALPLMAITAALVKLTSPGPALFQQTRLGRGGKPFTLLKFRTMAHQPVASGLGLTRSGDSRVTAVGRLLRQWKLDELPQLINVLRGDMSLVGPRPDLAKYYATLSAELRQILQVRPGVTGAASLAYRHEESVLAQVAPGQLEGFYTRTLLPEKVRLDLEYAAQANCWTDLRTLFRTLFRVLD